MQKLKPAITDDGIQNKGGVNKLMQLPVHQIKLVVGDPRNGVADLESQIEHKENIIRSQERTIINLYAKELEATVEASELTQIHRNLEGQIWGLLRHFRRARLFERWLAARLIATTMSLAGLIKC